MKHSSFDSSRQGDSNELCFIFLRSLHPVIWSKSDQSD